jgi:3-dehydroquinate dehydratase II
MKRIAIINGPNLNLLGKREPEIYGTKDFETFFNELKLKYTNTEWVYFQSNIEGELINAIQEYGFSHDGIILNAGAFTHTSLALADAVASINTPVLEVHLSNIFAREDYRHISFLGARCIGSISGLGLRGYELAADFFINQY